MHVALYLAQARYHVVSQREAAAHAQNIYVVCSAYHFDCLFEIVCMQPCERELNVLYIGRESLLEQVISG